MAHVAGLLNHASIVYGVLIGHGQTSCDVKHKPAVTCLEVFVDLFGLNLCYQALFAIVVAKKV